jgi:hypothetical protein
MGESLLHRAVAEFLRAPTQTNRDNLTAAADAYRDWWIEAQASGSGTSTKPVPRGGTTTSPIATTSYDKKLSTGNRLVDGIPVRLVLQMRTSARESDSWWVISWRTRLRAGGPNRRFYKTQETYWSVPAQIALELMRELEAKGALSGDFDDARCVEPPKVRISDVLPEAERFALLNEITGPDEDWGIDPLFVIADDPNADWRKVMIVNRRTGMATFRSLTRSTSYRPRTELRRGSVWSLDNSMMDAGAQQMRAFLATLAAWEERSNRTHS